MPSYYINQSCPVVHKINHAQLQKLNWNFWISTNQKPRWAKKWLKTHFIKQSMHQNKKYATCHCFFKQVMLKHRCLETHFAEMWFANSRRYNFHGSPEVSEIWRENEGSIRTYQICSGSKNKTRKCDDFDRQKWKYSTSRIIESVQHKQLYLVLQTFHYGLRRHTKLRFKHILFSVRVRLFQ